MGGRKSVMDDWVGEAGRMMEVQHYVEVGMGGMCEDEGGKRKGEKGRKQKTMSRENEEKRGKGKRRKEKKK